MLRQAYFGAAGGLIWQITPLIVTCVSFIVYVLIDEENVLTSQKIFVCLMLFGIMQWPMLRDLSSFEEIKN